MYKNGKRYFFKNVNGKKVVKIKEWVPCEKTIITKVQILLGFVLGLVLFTWSMLLYGDARDLVAMTSFFTLLFATFNMIRLNNKTKLVVRDPWCDELWMLEGINLEIKE